jgi:hypothetical protein
MNTTIHERFFLHHQCMRKESHCYKISFFNVIYPFCLYKERHLITMVVFFLTLHIVDSENLLFFRNNDVFLLIFDSKYVKYLCNSYSENSMFIFMTHISQVDDCEPIIIHLNILWVLQPFTIKYRDL